MSVSLRPYRLTERGHAGLACDENGLALGGLELARVRQVATGVARCDVRSPGEVGQIMRTAYGPLADAEILRLHRGLCRAAAWIEAGDLALAGIEAVTLGLPDLTPGAMAKLAEIADLEKGVNAAWETEPRVPAAKAAAASGPRAPAPHRRPQMWEPSPRSQTDLPRAGRVLPRRTEARPPKLSARALEIC